MIKYSLLVLLMTGWYHGMYGQAAKPVTISGQINSGKDSVKLIVWLARDQIVGFGDELERIKVTVAADGHFSFTTPPITKLARLSVHDAVSGAALFTREQQFVMPGDHVLLKANTGMPAVFSGKGAAKYECVQALKMIDTRVLDSARNNLVHVYDSLHTKRMQIIDRFKKRLTNEEYLLIKTDITGELNSQLLTIVCGYNFGSIHYTKPSTPEALAQKKKIFEDLVAHMAASNNTEIIPQSVTYRQFLYQRSRAELVFANNGEPVKLIQLFKQLNNQYTGLLREKLLGSLLLNSTENYYFFGGTDAGEHLTCLQEAYASITNKEIKARLGQLLKGQVKGAPFFNFSLPLDSSLTKELGLSDLKGKVILLDLWSYQCTGCVVFTNTFHKKIYPVLKDNPDFVVVSIMLGESSRQHYMRRLRREGGAVYTFPEYINLFGGTGMTSARDMERYHDINSFPTIMVLDKQGRIYSSTLPVIYGDPRNKELQNNILKLTALIQKALAEPGPEKTTL